MSREIILHSLAMVFVIGLVTAGTRFAPFIIFGRSEKMPKIVAYLGAVMPAAVITMLVSYCLRNTSLTSWPFGLPELIACIFTIFVHWFGKNVLISIAGGTIVYMLLIQVIFA